MNGTTIKNGSIATNRKARFNYEIIETYETGIVLTGAEVKSLRAGHATINESYATIQDGELYLINAHITEYGAAKGGFVKQVASRPRKLLVHRKELNKLMGAIQQKGKTLVPLDLYFNPRGKVKVRIGLASGKNTVDKREDIKTRDWNREKQRIMAHYNSGKK
ncbi:MAG: SsrA-binding protein SmpB [Alphaproteobacteria bacterium]|nr:SsrA-binding protein SmpB [Alphaproteobacteria bacterium]